MRILLILILLSPLLARAELYRWVDAQGQTHYTQTPPPGLQAQTLAPPLPPPRSPPSSNLKQYSEALDKVAAERAKAGAAAAQHQAKKDQICRIARARIDLLESRPSHRVGVRDASGNLARMTPEQHAQDLETTRKAADLSCS